MAFVLDDIYYALLGNAAANLTQFIQGFLMPVLFPILYTIYFLMEYAVEVLNLIINLINAFASIPNLYGVLFEYYFYWIPSVWAVPIYVGITTVFFVSLIDFVLWLLHG